MKTELFGPYCRLLFAVSTPDLAGVRQLQYSTLPDWPRRVHDLPVRLVRPSIAPFSHARQVPFAPWGAVVVVQ